jgi:hypothetical protein
MINMLEVHEKCVSALADDSFLLLTKLAQKQGNIQDLSIGMIPNQL